MAIRPVNREQSLREVISSPAAAQMPTFGASDMAELRQEISGLRLELRMLRIANAELERVAVRDTLTPLHNRRYFLSALNERIVRRSRYGAHCAILFVDINGLKHINDVHGHTAGDYALIHAAQILSAQIRTSDVAARLGGDEFALILEEVTERQARTKANDLEKLIGKSVCAYGEVVLPMSAAIGLTILEEDDREDAVIQRADADMYARKRAWYDAQRSAK
ncbi:MAG: GGDEF domain-containing protein [Sphingobium sp.]